MTSAIRSILIAPDKFKGSLTAVEVTEALSEGIRSVAPHVAITAVPVADGGDGTLSAAFSCGFEEQQLVAAGPTGLPVNTAFARRGDTAIVEMANICGLQRLPGGAKSPLDATSRGLGEVIVAALRAGCGRIVIGLGGSASTDGGAGMLTAMGAKVLDVNGEEIPDGGAALARADRLDLSALDEAVARAHFIVACDVTNPLVGASGAAHVFGPQKGANPSQVATLEAALGNWADVVTRAVGGPDVRMQEYMGAAGGVGFATRTVLHATMRSGIDIMIELLELSQKVAAADLVITGEGSLDSQSLQGKAPIGVARLAQRNGVPVVAVCGRVSLSDEEMRKSGLDAVYSLAEFEPRPEVAMRTAYDLLIQAGARLAMEHLS